MKRALAEIDADCRYIHTHFLGWFVSRRRCRIRAGRTIPLLLTPSSRRMVVTWAIDERGYSQRRACTLIGIAPKSYRYVTSRDDDREFRERLRILAGERRRFVIAACIFCCGARASS